MARMRVLAAGAAFLAAALSTARADDVRVVVGFHGRADEGVFGRHGGKAELRLWSQQTCAGTLPAGRIRALRSEPGVAFVEEDLIRQTADVPNDPHYATYQVPPYALIKAPDAWTLSKGDGIRVAVLDTGVSLTHPDLGSGAAGKVKVWKNFTSSSTSVTDSHGHGTHTAGTVGARTNNSLGVAGAGFNCELAVAKVLGPSGGYDSWIAAGMDWAWQTAGAKVISMSLGGAGTSSVLENGVNNAWNAGLVVVAAAGNSSSSSPFYPAAIPNCISVAATNNSGALASFSNFGPTVDIAAPGVSIVSTYPTSSYAYMSGTSMACPHVAGVAALVWATPGAASNSAVRAFLEGTASLPVTGPNAGTLKILDASAAVSAGSGPPPPPVPPASPTGLGATPGDGQVSLFWNASAGATSYTVKSSTTPGGPHSTVASGVTGTSYVHTGLSNGTTYYYVVLAVNSAGESDPSVEASATPQPPPPPLPPANLTATAGNAQVTLSWTASTGATSYRVKSSTTPGGPYSTVASGVSGTSYVHTGLANGTTYYYVMTAAGPGGESPDSAEASATPQLPPPPPAPGNLRATSGDRSVLLRWNASAGATSYNVKVSTASGGPYSTVAAGVTGTSFNHTGLVNGTTYYYVVSAVGPGGEGADSAQVSATPTGGIIGF